MGRAGQPRFREATGQGTGVGSAPGHLVEVVTAVLAIRGGGPGLGLQPGPCPTHHVRGHRRKGREMVPARGQEALLVAPRFHELRPGVEVRGVSRARAAWERSAPCSGSADAERWLPGRAGTRQACVSPAAASGCFLGSGSRTRPRAGRSVLTQEQGQCCCSGTGGHCSREGATRPSISPASGGVPALVLSGSVALCPVS